MILTSQPLVSVVTPVYNTEKYLAECIESVLTQTYENWEYVIVNNCSTDRSLEIAQHYARNEARICIHNNKGHLGLFQNWNHALRKISSESKYCKIVHADDWLFPDCITKMVESAEANHRVGIVGSYRLIETQVSRDGLPYPRTVASGRDICRSTLRGEVYFFGSPTTLLIRSDIIRACKSFYNENNIHSDKEVCFDILRDYDYGFVHEVLSFTRRHNEAHTTNTRRINTEILSEIVILKKYGLDFLSRQELDEILLKRIKRYYRFLGKSIFQRKGKEFWDYHRKGLKEVGYPINPIKLLKASLIVLYNKLLDILKID